MVTTPTSQANGRTVVHTEDGKVRIDSLVIEDAEVVGYLTAAEDPGVATLEALRVGVRVLRLAATSGDVEMVKSEFDAMIVGITNSVDKVLLEAQQAVSNRLTKFNTEELKGSLDGHRRELSEELLKLFGPESANSVQKQIDKVLTEQATVYRQKLAEVLERTDDPDNPLFKMRKELKEKADEAIKEVRDLRDKVLEIVGEAKGITGEREKGTLKGREYQQYVYEQIERIAGIFGDVAEYVADQAGERGRSKAGDVVVELNPSQTSNTRLAVVFEAKNTANVSVRGILEELEEAKDNRVAAAAVAVFSDREYVPGGLTSWRDYPGHRYVCVLREEEPDPYQLEYSYRMARLDAIQSIEPAEATLDVPALRSLLKQVRARMSEFQQMRTKLTGAKGAIEEVQNLVEKHQEAVRSDLDEIDRLLSVRDLSEGAQ